MEQLKHNIDDAGDVVIVVTNYDYWPEIPPKLTGHPDGRYSGNHEEFNIYAWHLEVAGEECPCPEALVRFYRPELTALARELFEETKNG